MRRFAATLVGIATPATYVREPLKVFELDFEANLPIIRHCVKYKKRVVFPSTSEVYGTARRVPIGEDHPLHGQSPYSASKIGADKIAESFHAAFAQPVVILRPFNTYGPRQSARAVIPTIITQIASGARRIDPACDTLPRWEVTDRGQARGEV